MNVLLISMPVNNELLTLKSMHIMPPMALYLLAAILSKDNNNVKVIDPAEIILFKQSSIDEKDFYNYIESQLKDIDLVGISSNTLNWSSNKKMIRLIRKINKNIKIVLGGLHPTYFHEHIMNTNDIDFILRGEGEKSLVSLINALEKKYSIENISGLVYRKDGKVYMNQLKKVTKEEIQEAPLPMYEMIPENVYPVMPIMTSRGCQYACRFCSVPKKNDWLGFDEKWVINNVKKLTEKYLHKFKTNTVYFTDDCFTADAKRACTILEEVLKLDIKIAIEARARDLEDSNLLKNLQSDKIHRIAIGVECGYDEGLQMVKKGLTIQQLNAVLEKLKKCHLSDKAWASFIYCFPWESIDDCIKTIDYAAYIVEKYGIKVNMNPVVLFPSQIWEERKQYGIDVEADCYDYDNFGEQHFYKTHPNFNRSDISYIAKYVENYEQKGIILRHN